MNSWIDLFAACAPGLEPFTADELRALGVAGVKPVPGGVEFSGSLREAYRANLHLHTASRILIRLGHFYATGFAELRRKASDLPWQHFLAPGQPVALSVTCHKSKLYHSDAVAERVAGAISDRLGRATPRRKGSHDSDGAPAAQLVLVRFDHDRCAISLDSSGELLHRRGYRLATAKAPLRETLAAGMLMASGWDGLLPLIDPFCGSGTIAIEAALMARRLAPGRRRRFAFMDWPGFDTALWQSLISDHDAQVSDARPVILASDRDAGAIESARANAGRAGVADTIEFSRKAMSAIEPPPESGWIVTNPPYGVRLGGSRDLRNLYAQFGNVLRAKCAGWRVTLLVPGVQLQHSLGLTFDKGLALSNGAIKVKLIRSLVG